MTDLSALTPSEREAIAAHLTEAEREDFEERAAIREFSGKQGRDAAERGALEDVLRQRSAQGDVKWPEASRQRG